MGMIYIGVKQFTWRSLCRMYESHHAGIRFYDLEGDTRFNLLPSSFKFYCTMFQMNFLISGLVRLPF
ncbi:MAG: hypothetical protein BGO21_02455 [Dyadobacter sp. 50-39]|nr:MAG: hypothetical protein BGO21_02455 [Dyadobacter sp. 50-39]